MTSGVQTSSGYPRTLEPGLAHRPIPALDGYPAALRSGLAQRHLPMLDGLRATAVFLVILFHFGFAFVPGGLGVLIFFVMSGFLITWLLLKEERKHGSVSLSRFYIRRSLRIFPAFYAYAALLTTALILFHKHVNWTQAAAAVLYVNNYYQAIYGDPNTGLSHTWSLAVEEQFYLLWPALFLLIGKAPRNRLRVPAFLILGTWLYRAVLVFVFHTRQGYIYEAFDTRFDHLMVGCLLAIILFYGKFGGVLRILCGSAWLCVLSILLLAASVILEFRYTSDYRDSFGFIVNPILTAILIVQLISQRHAWFVRWLDFAAVRYLGRISYSLYLYQQLVLDPLRKQLVGYPAAVQLAGAVAALVLVASVSFFLIEKPFVLLKNRYFHA